VTIFTRRNFLAALLATLLLAAPARAAEWQVSFETGHADPSQPYTVQATETVQLVSELGPAVFEAIAGDAGAFDAEITPGGYQGQIAPSVLLQLDTGRVDAERIAIAFGYVFEQDSVLVWREGEGATLLVSVELPSLTPNLADHFFRLAMAVNPALGGGFTARGNRMQFINLRGPDGKLLGGLDDQKFEAALRTAAASFGGLATVTTGRVEAVLIEKSRYVLSTDDARQALDRLRSRRAELQQRR
jgi:hypothetical protein